MYVRRDGRLTLVCLVQEVRMVPGKKGLAFVEFGDEAQAAIALQGLLGFKLTPTDTLKVSFAKK